MKKLLIIMLVSLMSVGAFASKIAMVDLQGILVSVNEGKRIRGKLEKMYKERKKDFDKKEKELKKMQESYKKQSMVMSEKAKEKKQREIQEKMISLQQMSMKFQQDMSKEENKHKPAMLKKINDVVQVYSKKH